MNRFRVFPLLAVLLLDGKQVLDMDGSHSPLTAFCFVRLEKGYHRGGRGRPGLSGVQEQFFRIIANSFVT